MLLRLFNFIYFQYITSMGLPSAPAPPRQPAAEIAGALAAAAGARAGPRPPPPAPRPGPGSSPQPRGRPGGAAGASQAPQGETEVGKQHGRGRSQQQPWPAPRFLSPPVLSRTVPASRPRAAAVPPAPALPHVGSPSCRAVVPWGPGPAGLAALGPGTSAASPPTPPGARVSPAPQEVRCLSFPADQDEGRLSLNTPWLLRQANTIREGLRGLIRSHKALEM